MLKSEIKVRPGMSLPHIIPRPLGQAAVRTAYKAFQIPQLSELPLSISQIKPNLYLGMVKDVAKHAAKHHNGRRIVVINANAIEVRDPLGDVEYAETRVVSKLIVLGSELDTDGSFNIQFATVDGTYEGFHKIVIGIEYKRTVSGDEIFNILLEDTGNVPIHKIFEYITNIIHEKMQSGCPVYVVCQAGISRSPTILAAYLLKFSRSDLEVTTPGIFEGSNDLLLGFKCPIGYIKQFRYGACPNLGFMIQLTTYAKQLISGFTDFIKPSDHVDETCTILYQPKVMGNPIALKSEPASDRSPSSTASSPQAIA